VQRSVLGFGFTDVGVQIIVEQSQVNGQMVKPRAINYRVLMSHVNLDMEGFLDCSLSSEYRFFESEPNLVIHSTNGVAVTISEFGSDSGYKKL
jgi:hypothetical protein